MAGKGWDEYDEYWAAQRDSRKAHFRRGMYTFPNDTTLGRMAGVTEESLEYAKPEDYRGGYMNELTATVTHRPNKAAFAYPEGGFSGEEMMHGNALDDLVASQHTDQHQLFGMAQIPGSSKVDYLGGTRAGRPHVLTMLGIAANSARQNFGRELEPSTDLSEHSSHLVANLASRGVLPGDAETRVSNELNFSSFGPYTDLDDTKPISAEETKAGRQTGRRLLRQNRRK